MDINEATAKALQAARAVSGLTFDELAKESGIPRPTVYRMFGAKRDIKLRLPEPDAYIGRTRGWKTETIDAWNAARPGRGVGGGRPRRDSRGA